MKISGFTSLALASSLFAGVSVHAQYADAVVSYTPGSGVNPNFTNPNAAIGAPSGVNPFGESVDPFNPPYGTNQIVALGAGGSLTLHLDRPIVNAPSHPFGIDFIVFANAGFSITNGDFSGGGITDGSLFGNNPNAGGTLVSVSADGLNFFHLDPSRARSVDDLYPTDASGNPFVPVNPVLTNTDFAGQDLAGIRSRYNGSAGGTPFDLNDAIDGGGNSVHLPGATYVKIDVSHGESEIDALSVLPQTASFRENFASDPAERGWNVFGQANLFRWNRTNQYLEATWDSSLTNHLFYRRLDTVLTKNDDFGLAFDLRLSDIAVGVNPVKSSTFELAIGLLNFSDATRTNFERGTGVNATAGPRNLVEFDYFPDSGFGATISPTLVSINNQFATGFDFPLVLTLGDWFHVAMRYTASNRTLSTTMTRNGQSFGPIKDVKLGASFTDFRLDTVAVSSYSDAGQDPQFAGSLLAHGVVDNVVISAPDPAVADLTGTVVNGEWQIEFTARTNWLYTLQRTEDFQSWTVASPVTPGVNQRLTLADTNGVGANAFYRVQAQRP